MRDKRYGDGSSLIYEIALAAVVGALLLFLSGCATITADCGAGPYRWESSERYCRETQSMQFAEHACCESGALGWIARTKPW